MSTMPQTTANARHLAAASLLERIAEEARLRACVQAARGLGQSCALAEEDAAALRRIMPGRPYAAIPADILARARASQNYTPILFATLIGGVTEALRDAGASRRAIPAALLPELAVELRRILDHAPASLDDDVARKDLSVCLLQSLPAVAQLVEEAGSIARRTLTAGSPAQMLRLAALIARQGGRTTPYFEIHTHTPMLAGFTPQGWERCYALVAELLRARPHVLGLSGGSWFYDPAVARVSPRLAYLSDLPLAHGAMRVRIGSSAEDVALATATSAARRKLVEAGEYRPEKWQLIWPRAAMLAWADARAQERCAGLADAARPAQTRTGAQTCPA